MPPDETAFQRDPKYLAPNVSALVRAVKWMVVSIKMAFGRLRKKA